MQGYSCYVPSCPDGDLRHHFGPTKWVQKGGPQIGHFGGGTKSWIPGSDVRKTHGVDLDHVKFDIGKHDFTPFRVFLDMWHHHETPESPDFQWWPIKILGSQWLLGP